MVGFGLVVATLLLQLLRKRMQPAASRGTP
jgi:hypothetical protein